VFVLKETPDQEGYYHKCGNPTCQSLDSLEGTSRSPGRFHENRVKNCPRCGAKYAIFFCSPPREIRIVRTSDGCVAARYQKSTAGHAKAQSLLKRLHKIARNQARYVT